MVIRDSSAVLFENRVLSQHQSVLTLLQQRVGSASCNRVKWLDLACGRGQILVNFERVIDKNRKKIEYLGLDVSLEHARDTRKRAEELFGESGRVEICDLQRFDEVVKPVEPFDFVTMTNSVHEIDTDGLAKILTDALCCLSPIGSLYVYDMERLENPELGAISWEAHEIQTIMDHTLTAAGVPEAQLPEVATWPHRTCTAWNVIVHFEHLSVQNLAGNRQAMFEAARSAIREVLQSKLLSVHLTLDTAAIYGSANQEDHVEITRQLYQHFGVTRALGLQLALSIDNENREEPRS